MTSPAPPPTGTVLVVDDSWTILDRVRDALSGKGFDVRVTTGSVGAVRLVRYCDLAIVDFHMPGVRGDEVVSELRRSVGSESECLFYLYTSDVDVAAAYARHGFDGSFLRKGDEHALVPQVEAVFRTIRMRKLARQMRERRGGR